MMNTLIGTTFFLSTFGLFYYVYRQGKKKVVQSREDYNGDYWIGAWDFSSHGSGHDNCGNGDSGGDCGGDGGD